MNGHLGIKDFGLMFKVNRLIIPFSSLTVGAIISGINEISTIFFAMLSILVIYGSAATINDIYDKQIDRITNPDRPIPSKKIATSAAYAIFIVLGGIGIVIAYFISLITMSQVFFYLMIVEFFLGFIYSAFLSKNFLAANWTLAFSHGLIPFLAGYSLFSWPVVEAAYSIAIAIWVLLFFTYNIKDLKDADGDILTRITLPGLFGIENAKKINSFFLYFPIPISLILFVFFHNYLGLILATVISFMFVLVSKRIATSKTKIDYTSTLNIFRVVMAAYILSLAIYFI